MSVLVLHIGRGVSPDHFDLNANMFGSKLLMFRHVAPMAFRSSELHRFLSQSVCGTTFSINISITILLICMALNVHDLWLVLPIFKG